MKWLTKILHRGEEIDREIDEELRFHIETRIERYMRSGMTPEEARRKALNRFGNLDEIRETVREIDLGTAESVWQDVRYATRTLAKSPGFTTVALLSLALGIGLNSAIFSAINAVLLRPLPYKDPERIVYIGQTYKEYGNRPAGMSPANFLDWQKQDQAFEAMAAVEPFHGRFGHLALQTGGESEEVQTLRVSASFFPILGVEPALGRTFLPEEDKPGASVAVLSADLWHRRFGADPNVLGRDIRLNDAGYRVVGVMPRGFRYLSEVSREAVDLWLPNPFAENPPTNRLMATLRPIARLKPGVTLPQARAEMEIIGRRLKQVQPKEDAGMTGVAAVPLMEIAVGEARAPLLLLLGAVGLVLLIACANVANLLLARAGTRQREIAIRTAMGAGRLRLVRQLLTESMLLALAGGGIGLVLAAASTKLLNGISVGDNNTMKIFRLDEAGVDLRVLAVTLAASLLTGLLFGLAPALHGSTVHLADALRQAGQSVTEGRGGARLRSGLAVAQVGLSLVLLAGAGLMVNSLWRLHQVRLGFNPEHLLILHSVLRKAPPYVTDLGFKPIAPGISDKGRHWAINPEAMRFAERVKERIERLPGVKSAAVSSGLPMLRTVGDDFRIEGQPEPSPEQAEKMSATEWVVSPDYFRTMGIGFSEGRTFNERDAQNATGVVIINKTMKDTFWQRGANVIGERITMDYPPRHWEIVGVADDVRAWPREAATPQMYVPHTQWLQPSFAYCDNCVNFRLEFFFVARTRSNPAALAIAARNAVREIDPGQPVNDTTMDDAISKQFGPWRSIMVLLGVFAGLAVLLSAVGIYGVISYAAAQRTHEIGVRMAMGAGRGDVLRLVMKSGLMLAVVGILLGAGAAYWLTRLIANQLYDVAPTDPVTFASVALVLLAVALLACYLPARRASSLDPMAALRCE